MDKHKKKKTEEMPEEEVVVEDACEEVVEEAGEVDAMTALAVERDQYLDMARRAQAEFENFRRRNQTAVSDAYMDGQMAALEALLPVVDNMERALESVQGNTNAELETYVTGLELVWKQLLDTLAKLGIAPIDSTGAFDPHVHNAVMQGPADDEHPEGHILETFQKGYLFKDKVLRYAMVRVAQ